MNITNSEKPKLQKSIVCFIDILGFKNIIEDAIKENKCNELLEKLHKSISERITFVNSDRIYKDDKDSWKIKIFTDNIVLSCPMKGNVEEQLSRILSGLCYYQLSLLQDGFFIRGGISVGDNYMDNEIVFGEALINAYQTESKLAVFPRIIFDFEAASLVSELIESHPIGEKSLLGDLLIVDKDDNIFVNYLGILKDAYEFGDISYVERELIEHKNKILHNLDKYIDNKKILEKYMWLARYHNKMCYKFKMDERGLMINIDKYIEKYFTI